MSDLENYRELLLRLYYNAANALSWFSGTPLLPFFPFDFDFLENIIFKLIVQNHATIMQKIP